MPMSPEYFQNGTKLPNGKKLATFFLFNIDSESDLTD